MAAQKPKTPDFDELSKFIVAELRGNRIPWRTAALPTAPINAVDGKKFYGFTALDLMDRAASHGVNQYATFDQVQAAGGRVRKGAQSEKAYYTAFVPGGIKDNPVIDKVSGRPKMVSELRSYPIFAIADVTGIQPRETRKWSGAEVDAVLATPFPPKRDNEHPMLYAVAVDMSKVMTAGELLQAPERSTLPDLRAVADYLAENKRAFFYAANRAQEIADVRLSVDPEYKARIDGEKAERAAGKADAAAERAINDEQRALEGVRMLAECPKAFDALGDQRKPLAALVEDYASRHPDDANCQQAMTNLTALRAEYAAAAKPAPTADAARAPGM